MASQGQDPIASLRGSLSAAQVALGKIQASITQLQTANPNDAAALRDALAAALTSVNDIETLLSTVNATLTNQQKTISDTNTALASCKTALDAANSKLAQVPKTADGQIAKPGMYFSAPVVGAIAVGVGLIGAFGGFWFRGTTSGKKLFTSGGAKEEVAAEETGASEAGAAERKRRKR